MKQQSEDGPRGSTGIRRATWFWGSRSLCGFLSLVTALVSAGQVEALQHNRLARLTLPPSAAEAVGALDRPALVSLSNASLEEALTELRDRASIRITFSPTLLPAARDVQCACEGATVREALEQMLQGTGLGYADVGGHVLIEPIAPPPALEPVLSGAALPVHARASLDHEPPSALDAAPRPSDDVLVHDRTATGGITGRVVDGATNRPLAAVQLFVQGTQLGTVTDAAGRYTLTAVPAGEVTLLAQLIGYGQVSQVVQVVDGATVTQDFSLFQQAVDMQELVVTGLASSIARRNLANAVATVSGEALTGTARPESVDGALAGKLPGVNIRALGGAPGGGVNMQFRGVSTLGAGGSQPLYIIDGVYMDNSSIGSGRTAMLVGSGTGTNTANDNVSNRIADINPQDIESIEVLKGPSAAAIYGARANAGVVIITTKRGRAGDTTISLRQDIGFARALRFLGFDEWTPAKIDLLFPDPQRNALEKARLAEGTRVDWEREMFGETGLIRNTQLDVSGGTTRTRFFVGAGYQDEGGIIKRTGFSRQSIRANIDHSITDRVQVSSSTNYSLYESDRGFTDNGSGASIGYNLAFTPNYVDLRPVDGVYPNNPYYRENPFAVRDLAENHNRVNRFSQGLSLNATLMERDATALSFLAQGGVDYLNSRSLVYFPEVLQNQRNQATPGDVVHGRQENRNINWQAFLSLRHERRGSVDPTTFNTQIGLTGQKQEVHNLYNRGRGLAPGQKNMGQAEVQQVFTHFDQYVQDVGVAGQQEVNWADRVIGTVGIRLDKSTLNAQQDEFYAFPKVSLAVNATGFDFWRWSSFDQVKFRAAYGETGGLPLFGRTFEVLDGTNIGGNLGSQISSRGVDPDLRPERAAEIEVGLDASLWSGRLGLEITHYRKNVQDLILDMVPATSTGISAVATNAADLQNVGLEVAIRGTPVQSRALSWTSHLLFWRNRTEITRLDVPWFTTGGFGTSLGTYLIREGFSPTTIVGTPASPELTVYGDGQPDWDLSWTNSVTVFGGLDLSVLMHYQKGSSIINLTQYLMDNGGTTPDWSQDDDGDGLPNGRDRGPSVAGRFIDDGSYFKVREVGLYYTVPEDRLQALLPAKRARIGLSARNLFLSSDYRSYDPEVSVAGVQPVGSTVEIAAYPSARRFVLSMSVDF